MPPRWSAPYDVQLDKNDEAWTGSMLTDQVTRLDTKTGEMVQYLLPRDDQHPPRVRRQLDDAGHLLGRQQPRRLDRQARAARLKPSCSRRNRRRTTMSARHLSLIAGALALDASGPARRRRESKPAAALDRHGVVRQGRPDGRRGGQRQEDRLDHHHQRRDRRQGPLQLPGVDGSSRANTRSAFAPSATTSKARRPPTSPAGQTATVDIKLAPTKNLPKQMSNAEWFASFPGTDSEKKAILNCVSCHDLDRIVRSQYDADAVRATSSTAWPAITRAARRSIRSGSSATRSARSARAPGMKAIAEYLASINLSKETLALSAQDAAAADRPRQPLHRHRIRSAAPDHPAARRRRRRSGHGLVHATSPSSSSARWIPRPARSRNFRSRCSSPAFRSARSISAPTRPAISGSA